MQAQDFFTWPEHLPFAAHFPMEAAPWAWLPKIASALQGITPSPQEQRATWPKGLHVGPQVWIDPSVQLPPYGVIEGPAWIGPDCELRPGVYVRKNLIAGPGCVLGNSCEYKNALLLAQVETAHFNYVGDSILGQKAHLGAGVICANLKLARDEVLVRLADGSRIATGLRKFGAILGDGAEVGCNSVLQPGTLIGRRAAVLTSAFQGYLPADQLLVPESRHRILPRPQ